MTNPSVSFVWTKDPPPAVGEEGLEALRQALAHRNVEDAKVEDEAKAVRTILPRNADIEVVIETMRAVDSWAKALDLRMSGKIVASL